MHNVKSLFKLTLGVALIAIGIVLEGLWLAFCFGTIVVGIVLLIWFTPILLFPFAFVSVPGWHMFKDALQEFNPLNVKKVSCELAPLLQSQISTIELVSNLNAPLDARVLAYVAALSIVVRKRVDISVQDVIDVTTTIYSNPRYKLGVQNLSYCIRGNHDAFWAEVMGLIPIAQIELAAGHGNYLNRLAEEDQSKRDSKQANQR